MLRKEFILIFLLLGLLSCGNPGNLYQNDEARIAKSQDTIEIARLRARANRFNQLEKTSLQLKNEIAILRQQGQKNAANIKFIAYKEARHEMGQITLQRQQESRYGNI